MRKLAKVHSSIAAERLRALGWTLSHEFRVAPDDEPYEYLFTWEHPGAPPAPDDSPMAERAPTEVTQAVPEVSYQIVMGSSHPGTWQKGSVADLWDHFFDPIARFVPPRAPLNDKLKSGIDRAGEHGIYIRWQPIELTVAQFDRFCAQLLTTANPKGKRYERLSVPEAIQSWEAWSSWVYDTQIEPARRAQAERARSTRDAKLLTDLKRQYRKALSLGDVVQAEALAERIRNEFEPSFS